jgi:predicted amino acid-binding ACT domain protein
VRITSVASGQPVELPAHLRRPMNWYSLSALARIEVSLGELQIEACHGLDTEVSTTRIVVEGNDRRGLLSDVASAITSTGTNIQSAEMKAVEGGMTGAFVVEVQDLAHLKKVIKSIRRVNGLHSVERREHVSAQLEIDTDA